jgi:histidinol phosphatase-like enzyme
MKKYFIDLDNTLCRTLNSDYINSIPIQERIDFVNKLRTDGHHITIWTARGQKSGIDHRILTEEQLKKWDIKYDDLLMGKPDYDIYLDDKSFNIDTFLPVPKPSDKSEKSKKQKQTSGNLQITKNLLLKTPNLIIFRK